jgi:hypothetical protein
VVIAQQLSEVSDDKKPVHTKFLRGVVPDHRSSSERSLSRADTLNPLRLVRVNLAPGQ